MGESIEQKLQARAVRNGPEAFSRSRMLEAEALIHEEPFGNCVLRVHGGLGSFSVGTSAALLRDGEEIHHTFRVRSWVYFGRDGAVEDARDWARAMLGDVQPLPSPQEPS
jgi:hypothetical protein